MNIFPQMNKTYENIFQKNTIDNHLFSINADNKLNIKKNINIKKQEENNSEGFSIKLEEVYNKFTLSSYFYFF
jgi:hypothetical protein